jgi:hypothetical protein
VDEFCRFVTWHKVGEEHLIDQVSVESIKSIESGKHTASFLASSADASCCLSIVAAERTLDLVADSEVLRGDWVDGLVALSKFGEAKRVEYRAQAESKALAEGKAQRERRQDERSKHVEKLSERQQQRKVPA